MITGARRIFGGAVAAGLLVVVFCGLLLVHDPLLFWNDDYELSILPVFADVARSWSEGALPLLSPYSWVCGNLAGEFQYGTFSIFVNAAVVAIWKFPLTFPQQAAALSIAHLFMLAMGGYLLARGRELSAALSTMVALVAALNGWIFCWGAIDWFGALGAFAWLPWAWWAGERALDPRRSRWRFLWPAPFVYLLVTGGFPYTVLMLALLFAWLVLKSLARTRSLPAAVPLIVGAALGLGLSAPAWLALFDYLHGSARQAQESAAHFQWVVPPAALPGFILPSWTVNWADFSTRLRPHSASEMTCGLVPPVALLAGLIGARGVLLRRIRWELGLLVVVLVISMLPSANVFRWSFRWLPFLHVILALCAAEALRQLDKTRSRLTSSPALWACALVGAAVLASISLHATGPFAFPLAWITLALAAVWFGLERLPAMRVWAPASITFAVFLATYLCIPPNCGVPKYNLSQQLTQAAPLDPQRLYVSIYPPAEFTYRTGIKAEPVGQIVRPGSTSMWAAVPFLNGYSPIRPAGVAREFDVAIHGELGIGMDDYVTRLESGPEGLLATLGVDGIVVASESGLVPQPAGEWTVAHTSPEGRVFHRAGPPLARVRSVRALWSRPGEQFALATISGVHEQRNQLDVELSLPPNGRPALLTISRPFFNGYHARLDDQELPVSSFRGLMPTIEIPAGASGRLTLIYRPWWLLAGGAIAFTCAAIWLGAALLAARECRRAAQ